MKPLISESGAYAELKAIEILIIEDSDDDATLLCEELKRGGYDPVFQRVETAEDLRKILSQRDFDMIVSDYSLPQFTAREALKIVQATGRDIPFIVVSGSVRESTIVETMRAGARDYVMKENLTRLPLAVERELEEAAERKQHREIEEQLRHTQRLESLGVLAGGVAHDFNNLLTGILGNVSLVMEEAPRDAHFQPMLQNAMRAAEQAANLTRQMLAYAGKGQFYLEAVNLSAVARDIRALLLASISKNVDLILDLDDRVPAVEADRGQMQQLLMNFVINGAEAIGPERAGTVLVSTRARRLDYGELRNVFPREDLLPGDYVCLEVRDTGAGMDAETQKKIFDPFFSTKFTGRGLGLSAVMGIVRSHKGGIRVESERGKGSKFTVFLPASDRVVAGPRKNGGQEPHVFEGMVLVIDDEETIRLTAKAILEKYGLHVLLAETGRAGVDTFRRLGEKISLVLLDVTMPLMSGHEVLIEIRKIRQDTPVIFSSGYDEEDALQGIDQREFTGFLQKPYTASQLLRRVAQAMGKGAATG